jgi:hypothetical protein
LKKKSAPKKKEEDVVAQPAASPDNDWEGNPELRQDIMKEE